MRGAYEQQINGVDGYRVTIEDAQGKNLKESAMSLDYSQSKKVSQQAKQTVDSPSSALRVAANQAAIKQPVESINFTEVRSSELFKECINYGKIPQDPEEREEDDEEEEGDEEEEVEEEEEVKKVVIKKIESEEDDSDALQKESEIQGLKMPMFVRQIAESHLVVSSIIPPSRKSSKRSGHSREEELSSVGSPNAARIMVSSDQESEPGSGIQKSTPAQPQFSRPLRRTRTKTMPAIHQDTANRAFLYGKRSLHEVCKRLHKLVVEKLGMLEISLQRTQIDGNSLEDRLHQLDILLKAAASLQETIDSTSMACG